MHTIADPQVNGIIERLAGYVAIETPSGDESRLRTLADMIRRDLEAIGARVEAHDAPGLGVNLVARFDGDARKPVLLLCHYDTVHPVGTITRLPFRIDGTRAYGPGIYDMKAGIALALEAIRDARRGRPITLMITCDEEIGSHSSRALMEAEALRSEAVLVLEPPLPDGSVKTARKGVGVYVLRTHGKQAHAGVEPGIGVDAIGEMARQVVDVLALANHAAGTTVNVGRIVGGTTSNVIAELAEAEIDIRYTNPAEGARIDDALRNLKPHDARVRLSVEGGLNRPPFVRTAAVERLFHIAREQAAGVGLTIGEGATGGASDGNFTAAVGVPTLDGLGVPGAGAHTFDEHILIDSLQQRVAFLRRLIESI
ncbi:MAG TPA: M20 family metallopeptidase [Longimicrobiales bacterium]